MTERAARVGVTTIVVPGVEPAQWSALRVLCAAPGRVRLTFAVGTHPHALPALLVHDETAAALAARLTPQDVTDARALGECGLDGTVPVAMDAQVAVLEAHLRLAADTGLPLILHCYKAHDRMLPLLQRYAPLRGALHSYSGGAMLLPEYVRLGLHVSFGGAITWENARKPVDALRACPRDRLLAETDGPDQCPRPHRGRCEPAYLPDVIAAMERLRGEALEDTLTENAAALGWA